MKKQKKQEVYLFTMKQVQVIYFSRFLQAKINLTEFSHSRILLPFMLDRNHNDAIEKQSPW